MNYEIKLIVLDAYGVCLNEGYPNTSKYLAKKYHKNWQVVQNILYAKYFSQAALKQISQKVAWQKAIQELELPLSVEQLKRIHYGLMKTNPKVLGLATKLKKHYTVALLSKNTREQFRDVNKKFPELKKVFGKNLINTWEYGLPKASRETMEFLCKRFNVKPAEIAYFDDQASNLKAPKQMGARTILYKNFAQFLQALKKLTTL